MTTEPDVPREIVMLAADALHARRYGPPDHPSSEELARLALEAAAPAIRAAALATAQGPLADWEMEALEEEGCRRDEQGRRILAAIFACGTADCPRPFALHRDEDMTGASGTGTVAHGVRFADGTVVIRWAGERASTVIWASLDDAMAVHGHGGKTRVVWLAAEFPEMIKAEAEAVEGEREKIAQLAERHGVTYREPCQVHRAGCPGHASKPFADLIREGE